MFEFHGDKKRYFDMQNLVTKEFIIPYLEKDIKISKDHKVLEIGCGEGGVLLPFLEIGLQCTGIELEQTRLDDAAVFMKTYIDKGQLSLMNKDIYDVNPDKDLPYHFDLIILKDVIEHIPNQEKFIPVLLKFLNPNGRIFFAFPPWQMPYGGHQQVLHSKVASKFPYSHLLPGFLYKGWLKLWGSNQSAVDTMMFIKSTGISIERFERIVKKSGLTISNKQLYLFNPIYKFKFGLKPRKQNGIISRIPVLRNFFTMGVYCIVKAVK